MARKRGEDYASQEKFYKGPHLGSPLPLCGGLLGGVLKPFSGSLESLDVLTPQEFSLKLIPGDDEDHQYVRLALLTDIARSGITTFAEAANACQITLGFSYDIGDLSSGKYIIGGQDDRVPNTLGPALGISKHGFFEIDNSISCRDAHFGNQADSQLDRLERLVGITDKYDGQFGNSEAKKANPEFSAGARWLAVSTAERVFICRALPNGTDLGNADYAKVAPFYLNETFSPGLVPPHVNAYSLAETGDDIANLLASSSGVTAPGENQGLGNFVPLGIDLGSVTPTQATCFLPPAVFDETPGSLSPGLIEDFETVEAFLNGAVAPFFADYDCPGLSFDDSGPDDEDDTPGVSETCNVLVHGEYQMLVRVG
ncbi:hypothetical protein F4778DRAFT_789831 [Xylariomycetidae sp. FL2044]|nr:hypothetical protein F4778DRAFT_789831 [Xylariomycetidae sp. FL2044]